jgi:hypothetical protein
MAQTFSKNPQGFRSAGVITEQLISSKPCWLFGVKPELTTTGTITLRDGAAADATGAIKHVCALGLTQQGKDFPVGVFFQNGLTVQLSVATDLSMIVYEVAS